MWSYISQYILFMLKVKFNIPLFEVARVQL